MTDWEELQSELIDKLAKATPNEINNWIENNTTDLESVKQILKLLTGFIALLAIRSGIVIDSIKKE